MITVEIPESRELVKLDCYASYTKYHSYIGTTNGISGYELRDGSFAPEDEDLPAPRIDDVLYWAREEHGLFADIDLFFEKILL